MVDGSTTHADPHVVELREELLAAARYFSADYFASRERFRAAATGMGYELHSLPINAPSPRDEPLTIDIAAGGAKNPATALVLSSGVHGVEGLFGAAVQLAFMERRADGPQIPNDAAVVLIHAVNPFGFAWQRRFNENNVDLNRNFLLKDETYAGAPPLAETFRRAMKPSRPRGFGFWTARMAMLALRHGKSSFWQTLPVGQYDYPDWLFFGGESLQQSPVALQQFLPTVLPNVAEVVHLDFHTGLGAWAEGELLISQSEGMDNWDWWPKHFGQGTVTQIKTFTNSYEIRGGFGPWLRALFPATEYRFATAEFGTYSPMRVIGALADELRWHLELGAESHGHASRSHLAETFVPRSRSWRSKTLTTALQWVHRATDVLWGSSGADRSILAR
jgi:predicted deacylase